MKVENNNDKIIVYLFNKQLDIFNNEKLNDQIKSLFIRIMKRYNLDFFGYNLVNVYYNDYYGFVLEIIKLYEVFNNSINLKIMVYKNNAMYLEFDDYYFDKKPKGLIIKNGKYYLKINKTIDINKYIEHGKVIINQI